MELNCYQEYLKENMRIDWEKYLKYQFREYFNFKLFESFIQEFNLILSEENISDKEIEILNYSILTPPLNHSFHEDKLENLFNNVHGKELRKFINSLDEEIKRNYLFYAKIERELYLSINSHLHKRKNSR